MIGLLFATLTEARPFLSLCDAVQITDTPFRVYRTDCTPRLRIIISGMGKVSATAAGQALILTHSATHLINAGACGALKDIPELAVGQVVRVASAVEGDHHVSGKRPVPVDCQMQRWTDLPPARLVTCDQPVFDIKRRNACAKLGEVVDMEGAAIARVAHWYGVSCEMIKGITDGAKPTHREILLENLNRISEQIGNLLWKVLEIDQDD